MTEQIRSMFANIGGGKKTRRKVKVKEALKVLTDEEAGKMLNDEEVKAKAVQNVEQNGIVFLDEIDKIASRNEAGGGEVSRAGRAARSAAARRRHHDQHQVRHDEDRSHPVHRERRVSSGQAERPDPRTARPLPDSGRTGFAVGGAISNRFWYRPTPASSSNTRRCWQRKTCSWNSPTDGIRRMAEIAFSVNEKTENIGARRLYTVIEKLLEDVSFAAGNHSGTDGADRRGVCRSRAERSGGRRRSVALRAVMRLSSKKGRLRGFSE